MHIALQVRCTSIAQLQHKQINKQTQKYVWKRTHAHWTCYCHFWKISKIIELTCTGQELNVQVLLMFSLKRNWKLNTLVTKLAMMLKFWKLNQDGHTYAHHHVGNNVYCPPKVDHLVSPFWSPIKGFGRNGLAMREVAVLAWRLAHSETVSLSYFHLIGIRILIHIFG